MTKLLSAFALITFGSLFIAKQNGQTLLWNLFDLELMVLDGQLKVIWLYSQNVHNQQTVQHLLYQFMLHLGAWIEHCQARSQSTQSTLSTLSSSKDNL